MEKNGILHEGYKPKVEKVVSEILHAMVLKIVL